MKLAISSLGIVLSIVAVLIQVLLFWHLAGIQAINLPAGCPSFSS